MRSDAGEPLEATHALSIPPGSTAPRTRPSPGSSRAADRSTAPPPAGGTSFHDSTHLAPRR
eukprot:5670557-Pyramimonas_sp.AAC.1